MSPILAKELTMVGEEIEPSHIQRKMQASSWHHGGGKQVVSWCSERGSDVILELVVGVVNILAHYQ